MKRAEAASEFSGILRLLREHAFLKYSSAGRAEFDQKLASASLLFTNLVSSATGLTLPAPLGYVELDKISDGGYTSLVRTVRRLVATMRRRPGNLSAEESLRLEKMCMIWEKAALLLASLPD
jgi:hypothetical protein